MQTITRSTFTAIKTEGGLLPVNILQRIADGSGLEGLRAEDYHLSGERISEAISRSWNRCLGAWRAFHTHIDRLDPRETGTTQTRERWLLVLFDVLGYGRLPALQGSLRLSNQSGDQSYAISHLWQQTPIHLVSFRHDLDRRIETASGQRRTPHSLMQELLNRSQEYQWGMIANGYTLRVLRDNASLSRAAYVEFDLKAIMDGELYAEFSLLWLVCHQSRVEDLRTRPVGEAPRGLPSGDARTTGSAQTDRHRGLSLQAADDSDDSGAGEEATPTSGGYECWLEEWSKAGVEQGTRALDALRDGVQAAIEALGSGFLHRHANNQPANPTLVSRLANGELSAHEYYQQVRRLVYRLLFLLVAEERDLLLLPHCDERTRQRYLDFYSLTRIRKIAEVSRGGLHPDLYCQLARLFVLLREGYAPLGLPALGSYLFSAEATPDLDPDSDRDSDPDSDRDSDRDSDQNGVQLTNRDLLKAIFALSFTVENGVRRGVDYRNLDTEELGSVYESLLELHPRLDIARGSFTLATVAGSERKTTGSYYTPTALVNELLNSALEPVIADRLAQANAHPVGEAPRGLPPADRHTRIVGEAPRGLPPAATTRVAGSAEADRHRGLSLQETAPLHPSSQEAALLSIKVLDFACGSGHMLIGAARRLALHLARIRSGDDEPPPAAIRHALRDVVRRCIYGVDLNATSVELCKVALWMETLEPGMPLGFLDANIRTGNSLLGLTSLDDLEAGIPDEAFTPKSGDDRATMSALRRRNKREREGQLRLNFDQPDAADAAALARWRAQALASLTQADEDEVAAIERKAQRYHDYLASAEVMADRLKADLWTAAFFWPVPLGNAAHNVDRLAAPTHGALQELTRGLPPDPTLIDGVQQLAERHNFFHWSLEYPHVYAQGGFDVILSNPPWERIKLQEKEWFAARAPEIANAPNAAARRRLIAALEQENPSLFAAFERDKHGAESESHFVRASGRYPLCGRGDVNTYALFAEVAYTMVHATGRAGVIVPIGIAMDDTTRHYFNELMVSQSLASMYSFENEGKIFPDVHNQMKFCLLTITGVNRPCAEAEFVFFARNTEHIQDDTRRFSLSAQDIRLINPNSGTCATFRYKRDADITKGIYRRVPVLFQGDDPSANSWRVSPTAQFHMSNDSALFRSQDSMQGDKTEFQTNRFTSNKLLYVPLYEAKLFHHFDHRYSTYEGASQAELNSGRLPKMTPEQKFDPYCVPTSRYWVSTQEVDSRLVGRWTFEWLLAYRRITNSVSERTTIFCIIPKVAAADPAMLLFMSETPAAKIASFYANMNSLPLDYVSRQKIGGTDLRNHYLFQLPVLPSSTYEQHCAWSAVQEMSIESWLLPRVLELTYTAWDLQAFARDCGYDGPPFRWDEERRFLLRCELDAAYFHLYGIERADVEYILDTFPIVKRKDIAAHGFYRTQATILDLYDAMAAAMAGGAPYATPLRKDEG